jgi:hypothetical protein
MRHRRNPTPPQNRYRLVAAMEPGITSGSGRSLPGRGRSVARAQKIGESRGAEAVASLAKRNRGQLPPPGGWKRRVTQTRGEGMCAGPGKRTPLGVGGDGVLRRPKRPIQSAARRSPAPYAHTGSCEPEKIVFIIHPSVDVDGRKV